MKKQAVLLAVALLLIMVVPAFAQSGVGGRLYDGVSGDGDPDLPWTHGGSIYVMNCDSAGNVLGTELYATINVPADPNPATAGFFDAPWGQDDLMVGGLVAPAAGDYVCLYVVWGAGTSGTPTDSVSAARPFLAFIAGRMAFGNIQSGTGPTAVTLQGIDGTTGSLPIAAGLVLVLLAGVTMFVVRRRQA